MNAAIKIAVGVALRTGALVAGGWVYHRAWTWFFYDRTGDEPIGADIGEGLVAFGLIMVVTALWGAYDGSRRPLGRVIAIWVGTGIALGLAAVSRDAAHGSWETVAADLAVLTPILASLVAIPAVLGAVVAASFKKPRPAQENHDHLA